MKRILVLGVMVAGCGFAAKASDPVPGEPLTVSMGQRKPVRIRVAKGQATLIRLPEGQRVMSTYGGDKGDAGVWSVDAGKVPTRFLAVKPKETGIHTTLHVISNTGREISFSVQEVTGIDGQFDAEVDAEDGASPSGKGTELVDVKWVPADDVESCKLTAESQKAESLASSAKAQANAAQAIADYQTTYPRKLFFDYQWDEAKAQKLGLERAWSDDKFTYFRGSKVLALYEVNEDGKPSLIQYRYDNGLYTVPKLLYDGYFAIGLKKQNKLTFHRERSKS